MSTHTINGQTVTAKAYVTHHFPKAYAVRADAMGNWIIVQEPPAEPSDVGNILGGGTSPNQAWNNAATQLQVVSNEQAQDESTQKLVRELEKIRTEADRDDIVTERQAWEAFDALGVVKLFARQNGRTAAQQAAPNLAVSSFRDIETAKLSAKDFRAARVAYREAKKAAV